MKGTIKIYANSIDKKQTEFGFDMNIKEVTLADKLSIIEALMDALQMSAEEKTLFQMSQLAGGFGMIANKQEHERTSGEKSKFASKFESMVNES